MQIITYLHSVSLLRIRQITIWKWAQKHSGRKACIMILSYVTADTQLLKYTQMLTNSARTHCSVQPLNWLQGYQMDARIWWRVRLIAASSWNWFAASQMLLLLYFLVADVVIVWRHFSNIIYSTSLNDGFWQGGLDRMTMTCWKVSRPEPALLCLHNCPFLTTRTSWNLV